MTFFVFNDALYQVYSLLHVPCFTTDNRQGRNWKHAYSSIAMPQNMLIMARPFHKSTYIPNHGTSACSLVQPSIRQ